MTQQSGEQQSGEQQASTLDLSAPLLIGFGITGQAVAGALVNRGFVPTVIEDRPTDQTATAARSLGITVLEAPEEEQVRRAVCRSTVVLPSPGVPDHHAVFEAARSLDRTIASEFDLAALWDDRPLVAITGTNGKTTVTMMVTDALRRSGRRVEAVGNTDVPLVAAIDDSDVEIFVVEASSFRLGHSALFSPSVATWLNFSPDHLDAHASLADYEAAKASLWSRLEDDAVIIANVGDLVVSRHVPVAGNVVSFGVETADWRIEGDRLVGPDDFAVPIARLARRQPHDLQNAAAAAATAMAAGASADAVKAMLESFEGLPHRVELVAEMDGVAWYNDSKATVPHATLAAVGGFESVVLIAGGRNKGLDLSPLAATVPPVRHVVAIGDSAGDISSVFDGLVPTTAAASMQEAIDLAAAKAARGDVVLLSPACTSFDWYPNYGARGDDFRALVLSRRSS